MPKINALRDYGEGEFYHVYNRGASKMNIFKDDSDYLFMLSLFKKYLSPEVHVSNDGHETPNYSSRLDLVAYCLMPNHYHLMIFLKERDGLEKFMRSVMTSYGMYFNRRHKRSGTLFEGRFLASRISSESYFWQISRYIHLNPTDIGRDIAGYPYSSVKYFIGDWQSSWVHPEYIVENRADRARYETDLVAGKDWHEEVKKLEHVLAGYDH